MAQERHSAGYKEKASMLLMAGIGTVLKGVIGRWFCTVCVVGGQAGDTQKVGPEDKHKQ